MSSFLLTPVFSSIDSSYIKTTNGNITSEKIDEVVALDVAVKSGSDEEIQYQNLHLALLKNIYNELRLLNEYNKEMLGSDMRE